MKGERVFTGTFLIDTPKHQQSILGFVVSAIHALYNTSGSALEVIWYLVSRAKYNYTAGQIWPAGQSLTPMP